MVGGQRIDGAVGRLTEGALGHGRAGTGADGVGTHTIGGQPARGRQGQRGDTGFCRTVIGLSDRAGQSGFARGVDQPAEHRLAGLLGLTAPVRACVAAHQEVTTQVHADHQVPVVVGHVEQHLVANETGVVHHDVQATVLLGGDPHDLGGRRRIRDVAGDRHSHPAGGLDLVEHVALVQGAGEVVHDHRGAECTEADRLGATQARTSSGHNGYATIQITHERPPSRRCCAGPHSQASVPGYVCSQM